MIKFRMPQSAYDPFRSRRFGGSLFGGWPDAIGVTSQAWPKSPPPPFAKGGEGGFLSLNGQIEGISRICPDSSGRVAQ